MKCWDRWHLAGLTKKNIWKCGFSLASKKRVIAIKNYNGIKKIISFVQFQLISSIANNYVIFARLKPHFQKLKMLKLTAIASTFILNDKHIVEL